MEGYSKGAMNNVSKSERETQVRVIDLFVNELGFQHLGDWQECEGNSNIKEALLRRYLLKLLYCKV